MLTFTLAELAEKTGCALHGDGGCEISSVADINAAGEGSIVFISSDRYRRYLETTGASAVIITESLRAECSRPALVAAEPRLIFARIANLLHPVPAVEPGVSRHAIIEEGARVADDARIEELAVVRKGAIIGSGCCVGTGCVIDAGVSIGANSKLYPNVTVYRGCSIGENCIIHSGAVIGADGFGFEREGDHYLKFPQTGSVRIGNNVEIGANTTIDCGALEDTVISDGCKLDDQVHIAHNVVIGEHTVISGHTGIAGTVRIGHHCLLGGGVGIADNLEITDNVKITGRTLVTGSILKPGSYSSCTPHDETAKWRKNAARFRQLDSMARRLSKLEAEKRKQD